MVAYDEFMVLHAAEITAKKVSARKMRTVPPPPPRLTPTGKIKKRGRYQARARRARPPLPDASYMMTDPCSYCGGGGEQFDHIEPLTRGGTHSADNLARVCWRCNRTKGTRSLLTFLLSSQCE